MLEISNTVVSGWEAAVRGMRNPLESWSKSDSKFWLETTIGKNDLNLMKRLRNAGTDHRKYMRFITVTFDTVGPLYFYKELDTYKVGTVCNSCSTMHRIHAKEFTLDDFSTEHLEAYPLDILERVVETLNIYRIDHLKAKDEGETEWAKHYWWQMIQLLPSSYNQRRTYLMNYEVLANIYHSRKNHKLDCWHTFCDWIETLPYSELITGEDR